MSARTLTGLCFLILGLASSALADPGAILVTARKRTEAVGDVPRSVSVVSGDEIEDAGARDVREAIAAVPNLNVVEFSARRLSFPFVRGIGSGQGDPAVATYVDGVPQLSIGSTNLPLLDVERIEVLRGPQGTLYGRNALGGLLHVVTRKPAPYVELRGDATVGDHGLHEIRIGGDLPLVDDLVGLGFAGSFRKRDGYVKNDRTGDEVDDRETLFGRLQVLFTPADAHEVRFVVHAERTRDGGFVLSDLDGLRDEPHRIDQDFEGVSERDILAPAVTWVWSGDALTVTAIGSYTSLDTLETSDFDFSAFDLVRRRTEEDLDAWTLEVRVGSTEDAPLRIGEFARVAWQIGALAFTTDGTRETANELRPGGAGIAFPVAGVDRDRGRFEDRGLAAFGHATVTLGEVFDVGLGLRYDRESKDADLRNRFVSGGAVLAENDRNLDETYDEWLPRIELAWRPTEEFTLYAYAARGFKAGGFNLDAPDGRLAFGPETSWTYELGVKTSLFEDRFRLEAALFHIDWDDMQLSQFDASAGGYVTNAGESTSRGLEVSVAGRIADGLDLFATYGATGTEIDGYVDPYGEDTSGNDLPFSPDFTWSAGAQYTIDLDDALRLRLRAETVGIGSYHYDAGNRESERYTLTNVRVGLAGDAWRFDLWVRNLLDEEYVPVAFQPNPADPSAWIGESGAPRTLGVTFGLRF